MASPGLDATFMNWFLLTDSYLRNVRRETLFFSAGIVLFTLVLQLWRYAKKRGNGKPLPPGSLGLPFIGETLEFLQTQKRNKSWEFIDSRVAKHGEIFKTNLVGDPIVMPCNPSGNKMVFNNENKLVNVWWPKSVIDVLGSRSLLSLTGDPAKRVRQAVMTFLRPEALQMYTRRADASVRKFLDEYWEGKGQVMVFPLMKRFTFSLACELLMSRYEKEEQQMLEEPFSTMMKGLQQLPIKLPGTRYSKAIAAANTLRKHVQGWIKERRQGLANGKATVDQDLLSCLLSFRDENGKLLTDEDMKDNILVLLFAGHDTSTVTTTMMCKYLSENPAVFDEVRQEQKEIAEAKRPEDPLSWADLQRMKLSWRVVQETLRLQPPVQGAFRVAIKDIDFGGFTIPKAWKIYWSVNSTHRNPRYFSNPTAFDPSRFEGAGPMPFTFVPFGGGLRMCPGAEFARMQVMVIMHHLVIRFKWKVVDPLEEIVVDPMPYPKKGLPIWLERRSQ